MSILFGRPERRSFTFSSPPIPPNSQTGTYAKVDLSRAEASLQKVAVWACVNLVATMAEVMPLDYYPRPREKAPMPAWLNDLSGEGYGTADWLYQYIYSAMLRGNVYGTVADIDRSRGTPTQILLQHPDLVRPDPVRSEGGQRWRVNGIEVDAGKMWHRRVHPATGQLLGLSPIAMHATTIGTGIAALRFGAQWFEEGAHPSGVLTTDGSLNQAQATTAKQRFMAAIHGRREPVVLGGGWKYQQIQISPNESQFLETNNYTAAECCRIFGPGFAEIYGYETGGSLTYSNIEQRSLDLLTYAVDPWLVRIERALSGLLPPGAEVLYNRAALVRTDLLTRYRANAIALRNRWKVVNEVRDGEGMLPVDWGDEPNELGPPGPEEAEK